jgi:hypothetical protein
MLSVASNDPRDALAQNTTGRARNSQLTDVVATIVLLTVHFLFFGATITMLGLLVMTTDPCADQKCGDPAWLNRAINLGLWAGGAILLADAVVSLIRLVRQRVAWFVPVIGCVTQLALAFGAAAMESMAGPVS